MENEQKGKLKEVNEVGNETYADVESWHIEHILNALAWVFGIGGIVSAFVLAPKHAGTEDYVIAICQILSGLSMAILTRALMWIVLAAKKIVKG